MCARILASLGLHVLSSKQGRWDMNTWLEGLPEDRGPVGAFAGLYGACAVCACKTFSYGFVRASRLHVWSVNLSVLYTSNTMVIGTY